MKRKSALLILLIAGIIGAAAQGMHVKDFQLLDRDLTANTPGTSRKSKTDGSMAALIKIVTTENGFTFDGGSFGLIGDVVFNPGEIWVYVPARSQKITITHPRFGVIRDYYYPMPIEAGRTYEMVIDPGVGKYVTIQTSTPRSTVYIDGDSIGTSPIYNYYMLYGKHTLRGHNDRMDGTIEYEVVNDGSDKNENITIPMTDQSVHFGKVNIVTDRDAEILMNGQIKGVGRWSGELREGNYVVETRKVNCDNAKTSFTVKPQVEQTIDANPPVPHKGYLQLFMRPNNAEITQNGKPLAYSQKIELPVGINTLTFSHKSYHSTTKEFNIRHNVTLADTINLERIQYLKKNGFYFGGAYTVGAFSGATGLVGATFSNIDLQLSYTFGMSKTDPVYFYSSDNTFKSKMDYKLNALSVKLGYQIPLATKFGIIPQLGFSAQSLSGSLLDGKESHGDGASCSCATIGGKFIFSPIQHFCLFAAPEYDVAVSKDDMFSKIADAANFSCGGFYCNIGVIVNF